jgi:hypothetical protein
MVTNQSTSSFSTPIFLTSGFQTILEEARHSLIIIEHDPFLYEDAQGMVENVLPRFARCCQEAAVLLMLAWRPGRDRVARKKC